MKVEANGSNFQANNIVGIVLIMNTVKLITATLRLLDTYAAKTYENWPHLHVSLNNSGTHEKFLFYQKIIDTVVLW